MIPKTTKVFGRIHTQSGLPAIRARGFATLDRYEIDNGFVVPHTVRISCDREGYFEADFWPNSRGSGGSSYTLELNYQGEQVFIESFVVPESEYPVDILDILQLQTYPPVDQSQQILTQTQALLLEVKANATLTQDNTDKVLIDKETTLHASALAAEQAIRAGNSAVESLLSEDSARDIQIEIQTNIGIAADKVVEASTSAQSALESMNSAALSEQNAVQSKEKAEAWAENPVDDEVEIGQYSAKHHAIKAEQSALSAAQSKADAVAAKSDAEEKALAASGSATSAGQSASNAAGSALSASEDRTAAQESAGLASGSADDAETSKTKAQQWAENPTDVEVETGHYSAKHHAAKAQLSAIEAQNAVGQSFPEAPVDGKLYGRQDAAWTEVSSSGTGGNTTHFLVAPSYAQTSFGSGPSSSNYAMKGNTIYVTSRCKLSALTVYIDHVLGPTRYFIQVYRVDSATHVIEEVLGNSNEVSGEGRTGVYNEMFTFGQTLELIEGSTYVIAVLRLDSGVSGVCRVRSGGGTSSSVGFATIVPGKLVLEQRLSAGVGDSLFTADGYVVMGFEYYTDVLLPTSVFEPVKVVAATTYTPVLADAGKYLRFTSTDSTVLTVPANASEAFPIGTDIAVEQSNTGAVSLVADAGVTINGYSGFGLKTGGQYAVISLKKVATDEWTLFGNLEVQA